MLFNRLNPPYIMQIIPVRNESEWEMAKAIRQRVFVEEQRCPPEEEWDAYDETSRHLLGLEGGQAVATARWRVAPYAEQLVAKLERIAVLPAYRGKGYGRRIVRALMDDARQAGFDAFFLHAQAHLESFYASEGFETISGRFMEAGIPHVQMVKKKERSK